MHRGGGRTPQEIRGGGKLGPCDRSPSSSVCSPAPPCRSPERQAAPPRARHSFGDQDDGDAALATDTLVIADGRPAADALQVKVRFMAARPDAVPSLRLAAVAVATAPPKPGPGAKGGPPASAGDP